MNYKIAVLPGDGIGSEVMSEGTAVLKQLAQLYGFGLELEPGIVGGASIDAHGKPLIYSVLKLAKDSDAVLLGAMGGPPWESIDYPVPPQCGFCPLTQALGLMAHLSLAKSFS